METIKQIVYRELDEVLMIVPLNELKVINPIFIKDLNDLNKSIFYDFKNICISQLSPVKYIVNDVSKNKYNIESETENKDIYINDLNSEEKEKIEIFLQICRNFIN